MHKQCIHNKKYESEDTDMNSKWAYGFKLNYEGAGVGMNVLGSDKTFWYDDNSANLLFLALS